MARNIKNILAIDRWTSGLRTNRNPLATPVLISGQHVIPRHDTLIDGLNTEISNRNTLERRPGFSQQCTQAVSGKPLGFYSFRNVAGTVKTLVDTDTKVQVFDDTTITDLLTKGTTQQTRFSSVANFLYFVDGTNAKKWDGATLTKFGIAAPTTAPTVSVASEASTPPTDNKLTVVAPIPGGQRNYVTTGQYWNFDDGIQWRYTTHSGGPSNPLLLDFTFSLPIGVVVTGMEVAFSGASQNDTPNQNNLLALGWWDNTTNAYVGTTKTDPTLWPHAQYQAFSYGDTTDLWGVNAATVQAAAQAGKITFALKGDNPNYRGFVKGFQLTLHLSQASSWTPGTNYALGAAIIDSNGNTQIATVAGTSSNPGPPIWSTTTGGTTTDGSVQWTNYGPITGGGAVASASLSPTSGYKYVYCYKNSSTPHVSTASPVSQSTGAHTGAVFVISGDASADPQVDKVQLYRTADGGATYLLLAEFDNASWSYTDTTPDANLNELIVAPTAHANDPPPSGGNNMAFHAGRLWMSANNYVYFSGGPDTTNGNPQEAWPPSNFFTFPGAIIGMAATSAGLLVFTATDTYIIRGLDSVTFYSQKFLSNFGLLNQNAIAQDGDILYVFTSQRQLFNMTGNGLEEAGFDIADQLNSFDPAASYLVLHRAGHDSGLFVCDGATNIFRYNLAKDCWSPKSQPTGGLSCIGSIQTTSGVQRLLVGRNASNIWYRNTATWADDGTAYTASGTIGSIVVSSIGNLTDLTAILLERSADGGTDPTVSVLTNEISGSFTALPNPVAEHPLLPATTSLVAKRHYLKAAATPLPTQMHHLQVKVAFPTQNDHSELYTLALMPPQ